MINSHFILHFTWEYMDQLGLNKHSISFWISLILYLWGGMSLTFAPIPRKEMGCLEEIFDSTNGNGWLIFGPLWNFTGDHNPCEENWEGLSCSCQSERGPFPCDTTYYYYDDAAGMASLTCFISRIFLGFSNLRGSLPQCLFELDFLTHLHLENNRLWGEFGASMGESIQILSISGNHISGTISSQIGHMSSLKLLNMASNELTGWDLCRNFMSF